MRSPECEIGLLVEATIHGGRYCGRVTSLDRVSETAHVAVVSAPKNDQRARGTTLVFTMAEIERVRDGGAIRVEKRRGFSGVELQGERGKIKVIEATRCPACGVAVEGLHHCPRLDKDVWKPKDIELYIEPPSFYRALNVNDDANEVPAHVDSFRAIIAEVTGEPDYVAIYRARLRRFEQLAEAMRVVGELACEVEGLARLLWEVDERVLRFVDEVSDAWRELELGVEAVDGARVSRAMAIAWERDELGARTRWLDVAMKVIAKRKGIR